MFAQMKAITLLLREPDISCLAAVAAHTATEVEPALIRA